MKTPSLKARNEAVKARNEGRDPHKKDWIHVATIDSPHGRVRVLVTTYDHHWLVHVDNLDNEFWFHTDVDLEEQKWLDPDYSKHLMWSDVIGLARQEHESFDLPWNE